MERELKDCEEFVAYFWDTYKYDSFEEADKNGDIRKGEVCYGYSSFLDAMCNVEIALDMLDAGHNIDYVIVADGEQYD